MSCKTSHDTPLYSFKLLKKRQLTQGGNLKWEKAIIELVTVELYI